MLKYSSPPRFCKKAGGKTFLHERMLSSWPRRNGFVIHVVLERATGCVKALDRNVRAGWIKTKVVWDWFRHQESLNFEMKKYLWTTETSKISEEVKIGKSLNYSRRVTTEDDICKVVE